MTKVKPPEIIIARPRKQQKLIQACQKCKTGKSHYDVIR